MSDKRSLEDYAREEELKRDLREAHLKLEKAKQKKADLVDATMRAAREAVLTLDIPPVKPFKPDVRQQGTAQVAVCVLSDWQLAKLTTTYDSKVAARRVEEYAAKVARIIQAQRTDHPVNEAFVFLLGDLVEGEQIFPGQSYLIDASLFNQTLVTGPKILGGFLRQMLTVVPKVKVHGVIGNHGSIGGRARKEYHPESNADLMLYEFTRQLLEGQKGLTWGPLADGLTRRWSDVVEVAGQRCFLFHGDQVKGGFAGFPWYGFGKKLLGWSRKDHFRYAFSGHFHTPVRMYINGITLWGSGSLESDNTYAEEALAATSEPCQLLLFMHPRLGATAEYWIGLK